MLVTCQALQHSNLAEEFSARFWNRAYRRISLLLYPRSLDLRSPLRISPSPSGRSHLLRRAPAQLIERGFINGTHFPSVLFSFSYTAGLRDPFIEALQDIRALYKVETTDRWFRVTKNVPVLRLDHVTLGRILPRVWEAASSGVPGVNGAREQECNRHADNGRTSDLVRDLCPYEENPLRPRVAARWRYTSGSHRAGSAADISRIVERTPHPNAKRGDETMTTAISKSLDGRYWRELYKAALSEVDQSKLPQRIADAEKAVVLRARELFRAAGDNGEETEALDDVMYALHALRSNYQNLGVA